MVRRAAVAYSWYPGQPARLAAAVERYLALANVQPMPQLRALVAPHAGLMYSGPVAACAYQAARNTRWGTIVLVGPSHHVAFEGVSIWPRGTWETPLGPVRVDRGLAARVLAAAGPLVVERVDAHSREHSLEMQLPFVAHLWPGAQIVPLVMGRQTRATAFALGDALADAMATPDRPPGDAAGADIAQGPHPPGDVLLVASSDLSHYEEATTAAAMDAKVTHHVARLDADGLMAELEDEPRHACGGGPIVSVLRAARRLGAAHGRLLRYADSGDVSGDKSSVVGYMAAAIW